MRRAVAAVLLLAACAMPSGSEVPGCDPSWVDVEPHIVTPGIGTSEPIQIECIRQVHRARLRIGFMMPAGPSCHRISAIDVVESADAVSITLRLARHDDPAMGACPDEARRAVTEIDLQAAVANRTLLDGSR